MNECDIITKLLAPIANNHPASLGLTDDTAIIPLDNATDHLITLDTMSESVHFFKQEAPEYIAYRIVATNLSDIAAMGGVPAYCLLSLGLSQTTQANWIESFCTALKQTLAQFDCHLIGGDTVRQAHDLTLSLTAIGTVPHKKALLRSTAQAGENVYVSGTLGDSYLGLKLLQKEIHTHDKTVSDTLTMRYHRPTPRLALGQGLIGIASACMDISDGLMMDASRMCDASGCGMDIMLEQIPLSEKGELVCDQNQILKQNVISQGDDYELLFTAPESQHHNILNIADQTQTAVSLIGKVNHSNSLQLIDSQHQTITLFKKGYEHHHLTP